MRKQLSITAILMILSLLVGCQGGPGESESTESAAEPEEAASEEAAAEEPENVKLYAVIETSEGAIKAELFPDKAPETVENFVGLAEGTKTWTRPMGGKSRRPFYDGLTFHRVIRDVIIQGGDPIGNGRGGPGYIFDDEIVPDLKFDKPGVLAMANRGPNTNGSQFFITLMPNPDWNGKYTIFGQVIEGLDVVRKISRVPIIGRDRPRNPPRMANVSIERVPVEESESDESSG